ncbi:MAG: hypothetical protein D6784_05845 [Chloroflexi bacterium]|nr:MAG: hypothetical protein D6784_05845 [Chloroflexota bacterium]
MEALNHFLFQEMNFAGNQADYYQPENSFLHQVLERRLGIPVSLSVVYLEVGWRLGLPVWGIALPGHFLVGYGPVEEALYVDVFHQGKLLSVEECMQIAAGPFSNPAAFQQYFLKPAPKKAILLRMLNNLKQIYIRANNWEPAYHTSDLMLALYPSQVKELRDRGVLAYRMGRFQAATFDLYRYLFLRPDGPDSEWLNSRLQEMEEQLLRLN